MTVRCSKNLGNGWMNRVRNLKFLTRSLRKYIKNQLEEKEELRCKCLRNNQDQMTQVMDQQDERQISGNC